MTEPTSHICLVLLPRSSIHQIPIQIFTEKTLLLRIAGLGLTYEQLSLRTCECAIEHRLPQAAHHSI